MAAQAANTAILAFRGPDRQFLTGRSSALICSRTVRGRHGVSTGSGSDRVSLAISGTSHNDPVATAPGTDLMLKLGLYPGRRSSGGRKEKGPRKLFPATLVKAALANIGSAGRTRTYNPSVNSRVLCH